MNSTHTLEQLQQAQLRRRRIVAAVDQLAREQAAAKAALAALGQAPVLADQGDGLTLLAQVIGLWGDEPATGADRD